MVSPALTYGVAVWHPNPPVEADQGVKTSRCGWSQEHPEQHPWQRCWRGAAPPQHNQIANRTAQGRELINHSDPH
jgi:hypothetical protein